MQLIVGTSPVRLDLEGDQAPLIQNLGPGNLFLDHDPAVSASTGFLIGVNGVYEFMHHLSNSGPVYVVADHVNTDVRIVVVG